MEALGEAQETVDFFRHYADDFESHGGFERALPDDPLDGLVSRNRSVLRPYGVWVDHRAVQFSAGARRRADRRGAGHRQHRGAQVRERHAVVRPAARRLHPRRGPAAGRLQLSRRRRRRGRRGAGARPRTAGVTFTGSAASACSILQQLAAGAIPGPASPRWAARTPCIVTAHADLDRAATGIVRSAFGMGGQKCSALSRVYVERARRRRAARAARAADRRRSASATRACARTGWARWSTPTRYAQLRALRRRAARAGRDAARAAAASCATTRSRAATSSSRCSPKRRSTIRCGGRRCSCRS